MSYLVSARRWRPQTFDDLVGQEHVSRTLSNAIAADRVAHAFLFTGVRGVGKTTAARILAKALNCEKGPIATPCNECANCREITAGSSVDVLEIDGASNTGVDDVREIIESVRYRPAASRFKIYIIDEVHMLSNSAFNALLKTLEEPPPHVKFIFATTDPHKLPATVQSRCQRYDFRRIPLGLVVDRLRRIVSEEGSEMSDRALYTLAREGEGSMRDAQSLLDQVLAYGEKKIGDQEVLSLLGVADRQVVHDMGKALIERDAARALDLAKHVYEHGYDLKRLTRDLVEYFRDLAVAKITTGALMPELPDEEMAAIKKQAADVSGEDCQRAFRILREADEAVGRAGSPKLVLEMALLKVATLPALLPLDDVLARIEEMEGRLRQGGGPDRRAAKPPPSRCPAAPRVRAVTEKVVEAPAPAQVTAAPTGAKDWKGFLDFATRERPLLSHHLVKCELGMQTGRLVEIQASGFVYDYLSRQEQVDELAALARRYFGPEIDARVVKRATAEAAAEPKPAQAAARRDADARVEVLKNPVVCAAVEILGGEVRSVRSRERGARRKNE